MGGHAFPVGRGRCGAGVVPGTLVFVDEVSLAKIAAVRGWCWSGELRALRLSRSVSTRDLARVVGVGHTTALRWERGERRPDPDHALALYSALEALALVGSGE